MIKMLVYSYKCALLIVVRYVTLTKETGIYPFQMELSYCSHPTVCHREGSEFQANSRLGKHRQVQNYKQLVGPCSGQAIVCACDVACLPTRGAATSHSLMFIL